VAVRAGLEPWVQVTGLGPGQGATMDQEGSDSANAAAQNSGNCSAIYRSKKNLVGLAKDRSNPPGHVKTGGSSLGGRR